MKTYAFKVVIEDDAFEDGRKAYHAYCPGLKGAYTYGYTPEEALKNIREVVEMLVEELMEDGKPIPESPQQEVYVFPEPLAMVTV